MGGWDKAPEYGGDGHWLTNNLAVVAFAAIAFALVSCTQEAGKTQAEAELKAETPVTPGSEIVGVASVTDGDTIEIHGQRIRIDGIDAPEEGKRCGDVNIYQAGSNALDAFIADRSVSCTVTGGIDRDGRPVAHCNVGGSDIGAHMVEQGYARDWPRYSDGEYAAQEATARDAGRGVWAPNCQPDIWPSDRNYSPR